jgi:hypothetical protein
VIRRVNALGPLAALALAAGLAPALRAQTNPATPAQPTTAPGKTLGRVDSADIPKEEKKTPPKLDKTNFTPSGEQVAELVLYSTGISRNVLKQVRHNGVERGQMTRATADGRTEEVTYERRFVYGETADKDKYRLDQKTAQSEFALVYNAGQVWGVINGTAFAPRQEASSEFISQARHSVDALIRYKENGATVTYVTKDKQKGLDLWIVDLTDKEQNKTRYYVSARTGNVLWLEYEETPPGAAAPVKYRRTFHDYRRAQGVNVPHRTVLYQDDRQKEETRILTITFGVRMDDSYFQNPQTAVNGNQF